MAGNVTGSSAQIVQSAAINYLQALGAQAVKELADSLGNEAARAALHSIIACAGASAQNASCLSAATSAGLSSVINSLLDDASNASAEQKLARSNLLATLMASIASATGGDAAIAALASQIETENNALYRNATAVSKIITPQLKKLDEALANGSISPQDYAKARAIIDASAAKIDALTTIYKFNDKLPLATQLGSLSPAHMAMLGEALAGFLQVPGMAMSAYELLTGKTVNGEEANIFFSLLGMVPGSQFGKAVGKVGDLVNALGHAASVKAATQIAANQAKGMSFEKAVLEYLSTAKNTESFTVTLANGKNVTVIPDAVMGGDKLLEVKNVAYLSNSNQMRAFVALIENGGATAAGGVLRGLELVVSPGTKISGPLQDMLREAGAIVKIFDPVSKNLTTFQLRSAV